MHSSDFSLFGFFTLRIYLWTDRVNFTSASLLRPDSPPSGLSTLSVDIHEDTYRGSQQGSRQPCVVCLSPLSRYLYDRENVSLALTRTDRKQSVIAPRGKMPTRLFARARSPSLVGVERKGVGASTIMCMYYLTS